MPTLVTVEAASELLDTSKQSLMVTACAYKRSKGVHPSWYISNGKRGAGRSYVDMDVLDRNRQVVRSIWMRSTDELYWILSLDLGRTDNWIATRMSELSSKYKHPISWLEFMRDSLFSSPPDTVYVITRDMRTEFFKLSIKLIALAKKDGQFRDFSL